MRLRKYLVITFIAAIGLIVFSSVRPALSYSSNQNSQTVEQLQQPNQSGQLIADNIGCGNARDARDSLQTAVNKLKKVSVDSQVLSNALDYSVQGLRAVNRYVVEACR